MTTSKTIEDGLAQPRRTWAMLAVGLAIVMAVLDGTISNVALPTIAARLHAAPAASIWVVNAYQLAVTVSLLPLASLGEIHGYQRVYRAGLVVFLAGSLACALSGSLPFLVAARVAQGLGAAGIMGVNGAMLRFIYPRRLLGQGIGVNAMVVASAAVVGPTVAAAILSLATWPYLFAVNLPFGLLALFVGLRSLPATPRAHRKFDWISAVLSAFALGLLVSAIGGLEGALGPAARLAVLVAGIACGLVLVRRQTGQAAPLPVDLLRIPILGLSVITSIAAFASQGLSFVALPFYLQASLGRTVVQTGLLLTPWPLALVLVSPLAGRLSDRMSPGLLGTIGQLIVALGLTLIALLSAHPGDPALVWRLALCGIGFGLFQTPNNRALLQSAPRARSGGASGLQSTARLVGQTVGVALVAVCLPLVLMRPLFDLGWARAYCAYATMTIAAAVVPALALRPLAGPSEASEPVLGLRRGLVLAGVSVATAVVVVGWLVLDGSSLRAVLIGASVQNASFVRTSYIPALLPTPSVALAAASLALSVSVCVAQRWGRFAGAVMLLVNVERLGCVGAAVSIMLQPLFFHLPHGGPTGAFKTSACFGWLLMLGWRRGEPARLGLGLTAAMFVLYAFPVGGSQRAFAGLFMFALAPVLLWDCWRDLQARAWSSALSLRLWPAVRCGLVSLPVLGLAGLLRGEIASFSGREALALPGAGLIRVDHDVARSYAAVASGLGRCPALYTAPGMLSFYLWTGQRSPAGLNITNPVESLSMAQQALVVRDLVSHPDLCLLTRADLRLFWSRGEHPDPTPIEAYLRGSFGDAEIVGPFELSRPAVE